MRTIKRRVVSAYIVSSDKKILLGMKDPDGGGTYVECWHNIGGGVDAGESDEQALKREVLEETGIDISEADIRFIDDKITGESTKRLPTGEKVLVKMHGSVYKVSIKKPVVEIASTPGDDLVTLKWFRLSQFEELNLMTPPAKELLARIGKDWLYN